MSEKTAKIVSRKGFTPAKPGWKANAVRAKSVGEFVPALMRPAFEKYGFPAAAILTEWTAIAGAEMAAFTAPERLKWPRRTGAEDEGNEKGATLILRVAGARALEVEHMRQPLIERINAAFGYRAVAEIRVLQAPLARPKSDARPPLPAASPANAALLSALPEDRLKQAFTRMASGLEARRASAAAART
ncbi:MULTISPECIES: DciA family protein [Rhodomicrobium]|uniref:DUF721 domain-containing protein n=1 Tax=Rhodomicrobium TaxID=1068 RepID=UPI000B4A864E|nr:MULTISPECIES: DciA family protein [Rhodomicrobium]